MKDTKMTETITERSRLLMWIWLSVLLEANISYLFKGEELSLYLQV